MTTVKLLVINNAEPEDLEYNKPLTTAVAKFSSIEVIEYRDAIQCNPKKYSGILLSGVPKTYSYETIDDRLKYIAWIKETTVPILGICLGHENIGRLYGAAVYKDIEAEEGPAQLQILQEDPLFTDVKSTARFLASHRASISLPAEFMQLASSTACKNQIMKHRIKPIYGLQFHPELTTDGIQLLRNFVSICN